jgi:hypothetical protein
MELTWPVVGLILGFVALLMFKRNIAGCIDKIRKIERGGVSIGVDQPQPTPDPKDSGFNQVMDATSSPLLATATPPKRGHSYRVIMGTFSWSSDMPEKSVDTLPVQYQFIRIR